MESVTESPSYIWFGILFAVVYVLLRALFDRNAKDSAGEKNNSRKDNEGILRTAVIVFLSDSVFLLAYIFSGLPSALVCRIGTGIWGLGRGWPFRPETKPIWQIYKLALLTALALIAISGSGMGFHIYGLLIFTVNFGLVSQKFYLRISKDEGGGTLNKIKVSSILLISYLSLLTFSEFLWLTGGLDLWIWFFILMKLTILIGVIFAMFVLLPFAKVAMKAVDDTSKSLR